MQVSLRNFWTFLHSPLLLNSYFNFLLIFILHSNVYYLNYMNKLKFSPNALWVTELFVLLITYDTAILTRKAAISRVKNGHFCQFGIKKDYLKISKHLSKIIRH